MNYLCVRRDLEPGHTNCLPLEFLRRVPDVERSAYIENTPPHTPLVFIKQDQYTDVYRPRLGGGHLFSSTQMNSMFGTLPFFLRPTRSAEIFLLRSMQRQYFDGNTPLMTNPILFFTSDGEAFERVGGSLDYLGSSDLVRSVHHAVGNLYESYQEFVWSKMSSHLSSDTRFCGVNNPPATPYRARGEERLADFEAITRRISRDLRLGLDDEAFSVQADLNLQANAASDVDRNVIVMSADILNGRPLLQETVLAHELGHFRYDRFFFFGLQNYISNEFEYRAADSECRRVFMSSQNVQVRNGLIYDGDVMSEAYARLTEVSYFYHNRQLLLFNMSPQERSHYYAPGTMAGEWFENLMKGRIVPENMLALTLAYFLYNISGDDAIPFPVLGSLCAMISREAPVNVRRSIRQWMDGEQHDLMNELRGGTFLTCDLPD